MNIAAHAPARHSVPAVTQRQELPERDLRCVRVRKFENGHPHPDTQPGERERGAASRIHTTWTLSPGLRQEGIIQIIDIGHSSDLRHFYIAHCIYSASCLMSMSDQAPQNATLADGGVLCANRTQESFAYTTPTSPHHSPAGAVPAGTPAEENRFQNLLDTNIRRSQIERLVAPNSDDDNFESTQIDPYLECTQLDSPVAQVGLISFACVDIFTKAIVCVCSHCHLRPPLLLPLWEALRSMPRTLCWSSG